MKIPILAQHWQAYETLFACCGCEDICDRLNAFHLLFGISDPTRVCKILNHLWHKSGATPDVEFLWLSAEGIPRFHYRVK